MAVVTTNRDQPDPEQRGTQPPERVLRSTAAQSPFTIAFRDFHDTWALRRLWLRLGYMDVRRRYRKTILGPFWATGQIAVYIICVGFIFSNVLSTDRDAYIPYLTTGFIAWMFVYTNLQETSGAFIGASSLRQQLPFPYSMFIAIAISKNLIVNIHNYSLYFIVMLFYPVTVNWSLLLLIPGYILVVGNLTWISLLLATLAARYRDVVQLVASVIQVMIFVTPIFWSPDMISGVKRTFVLMPNLLYHLTVVIRAPLLGEVPPLTSYLVLLVALFVGTIFTAWFFGKRRSQIVFWIM